MMSTTSTATAGTEQTLNSATEQIEPHAKTMTPGGHVLSTDLHRVASKSLKKHGQGLFLAIHLT
jgi:hypothetical protein